MVTVLALTACQTMSADQDQPALISEATEASRAALKETVNTALHSSVTLADDALTKSSVLTVELNPPAKIQNPNPLGRDMGRPTQSFDWCLTSRPVFSSISVMAHATS
jgi:hypothetical protein